MAAGNATRVPCSYKPTGNYDLTKQHSLLYCTSYFILFTAAANDNSFSFALACV